MGETRLPPSSPSANCCPWSTSPTRALPTGWSEDAAGLAVLADRSQEMLVAETYSKNFGLYNERVGAHRRRQDKVPPGSRSATSSA